MKFKHLLAVIFSLICCITANAQVAATNAPPPVLVSGSNNIAAITTVTETLGFGTNVNNGIANTLNLLADSEPYFGKDAQILLEGGVLKDGSHLGGFLSLKVPLNTNSWQMSYGVSAAYIDHEAYSGALNVSLGTTVTVPGFSQFLGPVYLFAESGPGYNFQKNGIVAQSFAGLEWQHTFGTGTGAVGLMLSYGVGNISDVQGTLQEFSAGVSCASFKWLNPANW